MQGKRNLAYQVIYAGSTIMGELGGKLDVSEEKRGVHAGLRLNFTIARKGIDI
jgi:hypothetical protein